MSEKEVKAKISIDLDEAAFVRLKSKLDKEFQQIQSNMRKAFQAEGLKENEKYINQFSKEFIKAKEIETQKVQSEAEKQARIAEKHSQRIQREAEKQAEKQEQLAQRIQKEAEKQAEKQTRAVQREAEKQVRIQRREADERIADEERVAKIKQRIQEQTAGLLGGYRVMRGMRAWDMSENLSSETGGKGVGGTVAALIGSIQPEVILAAGAFESLNIASQLLSEAFGFLKQTGMEVASSLAQIGGAKGLEGLIVGSATQERFAAKIAGNSNMGKSQIINLLRDMGANSEFGQEQTSGIVDAYLKAGGQNSMKMLFNSNGKASEFSKFITDTATVSGASPEQVAKGIGDLVRMNPSDTPGQIQDKAINLWKLGKNAGVNYFENPDIVSREFLPGETSGLGITGTVGLSSLVSSAMGGKTNSRQVLTQIQKYFGKGGGTLNSLISQAYSGGPNDTNLPGAVAQAYANSHSGQKASSAEEMKQFVNSMIDSKSAIEDFNHALEENTSTVQYKMKNAWNDIEKELDSGLLPVLQELVNSGVITEIANTFKDHKEDIANGVKDLAKFLPLLVKAFIEAISVMRSVLDYIEPKLKAIGITVGTGIGNAVGGPLGGTIGGYIGSLIPNISPSQNTIPQKSSQYSASGQPDTTVHAHKETAKHTQSMEQLLKEQNIILTTVSKNTSIMANKPITPPQHKPIK